MFHVLAGEEKRYFSVNCLYHNVEDREGKGFRGSSTGNNLFGLIENYPPTVVGIVFVY